MHTRALASVSVWACGDDHGGGGVGHAVMITAAVESVPHCQFGGTHTIQSECATRVVTKNDS